MKRFHFPLERIRQFRRLQMETEESRLAECRQRLEAVNHMVAELDRQREDADEDARRRTGAGLAKPAELESLALWRGHARRLDAELAERRSKEAVAVELQRRRLVEARRKYEILDRLRDKTLRGWRADWDRETEALAGELYLSRWSR